MNSEPTQAPPSTQDFTTRTRIIFFLTGNIVPSLLLMACARSQVLDVTWQSGQFHDYAALLLSGSCGWVFYPFFIYAVAAFTLGMMRPRQVCHSRIVLFGVMTGVLLSLQTCFLLSVVWTHLERLNSWNGFLLVGILLPLWGLTAISLPWLAWWFAKWISSKLRALSQKRWWIVLLMFTGPLLCLALGSWFGEDAYNWVIILLLLPTGCVLAGGPFWIVAAYLILLVRLFRFQQARLRYRLADLLGIFLWLGAYLAAWRVAVEQAVETYATLPTTPPSNCYVASAAARGHARFVGSYVMTCATGETVVVNTQLQYLKCGELAFKMLFPRLYREVRGIYDSYGPICANQLNGPLMADAAYITLKPVEWFVRISFVLFAPRLSKIASRLYQGRHSSHHRSA